jgi:hypothetical protein
MNEVWSDKIPTEVILVACQLERENAKLLAANAELITLGAELSATRQRWRAENAELRRQVALDYKVKLLLSKYNESERERADGLARENAELRADKARLDWLDRNALLRQRTLAIMERDGDVLRWAGVEWSGEQPDDTLRAAIDAAMEEIK